MRTRHLLVAGAAAALVAAGGAGIALAATSTPPAVPASAPAPAVDTPEPATPPTPRPRRARTPRSRATHLTLRARADLPGQPARPTPVIPTGARWDGPRPVPPHRLPGPQRGAVRPGRRSGPRGGPALEGRAGPPSEGARGIRCTARLDALIRAGFVVVRHGDVVDDLRGVRSGRTTAALG